MHDHIGFGGIVRAAPIEIEAGVGTETETIGPVNEVVALLSLLRD